MLWLKTISFAGLALCWGIVHAGSFSSGSNGSFGAILVESNTTIDLPPNIPNIRIFVRIFGVRVTFIYYHYPFES